MTERQIPNPDADYHFGLFTIKPDTESWWGRNVNWVLEGIKSQNRYKGIYKEEGGKLTRKAGGIAGPGEILAGEFFNEKLKSQVP